MPPDRDLLVIDRGTGEAVRPVDAAVLLAAAGLHDVEAAELGALGEFDRCARELKSITDEASGVVNREIIRRLDRRGKWTLREDGFEFKAPSPETGTTDYDTDRLRVALRGLVTEDIIDAAAANAAIDVRHPTAALTAADLDEIEGALKGDRRRLEPALATVAFARAKIADETTTYKPRVAGIKALLKLGGEVAEAVRACRVAVEPPARRAKVAVLPGAGS